MNISLCPHPTPIAQQYHAAKRTLINSERAADMRWRVRAVAAALRAKTAPHVRQYLNQIDCVRECGGVCVRFSS